MNRLGALLFTPLGFAVGYVVGGAAGGALASPGYEYDVVRPLTKKELEYETNGEIIGSLVGATLIAILAAGPSEPKPAGTVGGAPRPLRFL